MKPSHSRTTFPLHNFIYLMRGRPVTADSVRHVLRALARQGQIPEVPYFTIVRCSTGALPGVSPVGAPTTAPAVYLDLGYSATIDEQTLVVPFAVDCDGDAVGALVWRG